MADEPATEPVSSSSHCPWCSAELPSAATATCPSCGATLIGESEAPLPGVTAIDAEAIIRATRAPVQRRSRLLSWISGDEGGEEPAPAPPGSLEPPPAEVRREMLRLELEAEVANLQAEADALEADARVEADDQGLPAAYPTPDVAAPEAGAPEAAAPETPATDASAPDSSATDTSQASEPVAETGDKPS